MVNRLSRRSVLRIPAAVGGITAGDFLGAPACGVAPLGGGTDSHLPKPFASRVGPPDPGKPFVSRVGPPDPWKAREIRAEFLHAWKGYQRHAWGHDELLPISGGFREFFSDRYSVGLSIIEALDTHYVMELDDEVARCLEWITARLDFDLDAEFPVFEAIIRLVGGLLAGYLATSEQDLLSMCVDLADRLLPAFTRSPTGMPYRHVNLRTGAVTGSTVPLAEIGIPQVNRVFELARSAHVDRSFAGQGPWAVGGPGLGAGVVRADRGRERGRLAGVRDVPGWLGRRGGSGRIGDRDRAQ
ncbi:glycoside hydrolase family 47 protein [Streptomyces sp. NPDC005148]